MARTLRRREADIFEALCQRPPTPKQKAGAGRRLYPYYAGYGDAFVRAVLSTFDGRDGALLVDPWNGGGATTSIASQLGIRSVGYDANPAAAVIAKAALLSVNVVESLAPLAKEVIAGARRSGPVQLDDEPLAAWFTPRGASAVRALERSAYRLLVSSGGRELMVDRPRLSGVSALAAIFYMALFATVRSMTRRFAGTNPTWMRREVPDDQKCHATLRDVARRFDAQMPQLARAVKDAGLVYEGSCPGHVEVADSTALPMKTSSADALISSPPYCTRIDYVVAMLPELALLGFRKNSVRDLREKMIGTPTISQARSESVTSLTPSARSLVRTVSRHPSHGARAYYAPFFEQYLHGMAQSLNEVDRIVRPGGPVVLVVQDSYFKDIHVDLARLLREMAQARDWRPVAHHRYRVPTKAAINGRARKYSAHRTATESVLVFEGHGAPTDHSDHR